MHIIFQSGQFYSEPNSFMIDLFGSLIGALISGLFAIAIFIIGNKHEKKKRMIIENKRISDISDFLKNELTLIQDAILAQSNSFINFSHLLRNRDFKDKSLTENTALKIVGIKSISYTDLYKVFTLKDTANSTKYNEFRANMEFLNGFDVYIHTLLNSFEDTFQETQKEFGENIIQFQAFYDIHLISPELKSNPDLFKIMAFWSEKFKHWQSIDEKTIDNYRTDQYIVYDEIIAPIMQFIRSNKQINSKALEILNIANKCDSALKNYDHARRKNREIFIRDARQLIKIRNNITDIIKIL